MQSYNRVKLINYRHEHTIKSVLYSKIISQIKINQGQSQKKIF